ncbi:MAG: IclR family transcriptional regulator [Lacisediminihabitans sp.]
MISPASGSVTKQPRLVRSVVHASALLKALHRMGGPSTLSDLARKVGLSKPATHTLLKTLELSGFVVRDSNSRYQLGWGLYELGSSVARSLEVTKVARMHLDRLAELTGEAVLLGILDNSSVLYLDRGQAGEPFSMVANIGRRSPLHTNASGKVLLAYQNSRYINRVAKESLAPTTSLTITDANGLRMELGRIREHGYATCWQEQEIGLASVAVPIFGSAHSVQAALAIAGPTKRLDKPTLPRLLAALRATASDISRQLA